MIRRPPRSTLFTYRRSSDLSPRARQVGPLHEHSGIRERAAQAEPGKANVALMAHHPFHGGPDDGKHDRQRDRKTTRLNSSHGYIPYAVFCLKKKTTT